MSPSRWIELLVLLPLGALPLARCYFKVPYLFCHACPRPCAFGIMRPYLVPAACLANLDDRRFCEKACPLGMAQRACERTSARSLPQLAVIGFIARLLTLGLTVTLYVLVLRDRRSGIEGSGAYAWLFDNSYSVSLWIIGAFAAMLLASFFVRRPFCDGVCPIGATSDLLSRLERRWWMRRPSVDARPQDDEAGPA